MTQKIPGAGRLDRILGYVSAIPLALIVALTFADVFARYFFARPIPGAAEMIQFSMAITIFAALPLVTRAGGHITVDFFSYALSPGKRVYLQIPCELFSGTALALISWRLWTQAVEHAHNDTTTLVLRLPLAPLAYLMAGLAALAFVAVGLRVFVALRTAFATPETTP